MKNNILILLLSSLLLIGCNKKDAYILSNGGIKEAVKLEENLESQFIPSNAGGALPWNFLPVDSQFVFTNPVKYRRTAFETLPMKMRAYSDSLGNEILIYEWDLITNDMTPEEKKEVQLSFDDHHGMYVGKYNQLLNEISNQLGPAKKVGANIEKVEMEVYKKWSTKSLWIKEEQVVELHLLLAPQEIYRIILKNLVYSKKEQIL